MKRIALIPLAAVALTAAPTAAPAAVTREYEGTVVSVNRDARTFRLRDAQRGTIRIRVTSRTRFERVDGLSGLRKGMTNIEAVVRRTRSGAWRALAVERSGGGGQGGGSDDD